MKISNYLFAIRKNNKLSAVIALLVLFTIILGCGGSKPETPSEAAAQSLVKSTLSDFADGVDKEDFSSLRNKTSKEFQDQFSADQMKTAFKSMIDVKAQAVPILRNAAGMSPKFTTPPSVREEKGSYVLSTAGEFATTPLTTFEYEYLWRDGAWKLITLKTFIKN